MNLTNTFKTRLRGDESLTGLWLASASSYVAEIAATAGYDWLLIDGEHAPNDLQSTLAQLQAVAAYPSHPVVRALDGNPARIKQLLDIGAETLLVPMVESEQAAQALVSAVRYPPVGIRGVGASIARASRWGSVPDYYRQADTNICLLLQVESALGLENLNAIAQVDGVDGIFIGPADLSASMGHLGDPGHPSVQAAIRSAIARIRANGKAAGYLATAPQDARRAMEWGANFVAIAIDTQLLALGMRNALAAVRGTSQEAPGSAY
jgi:4-hydroxy-2-oxoheptanedioate aldolase